jgi:hypothetical protein
MQHSHSHSHPHLARGAAAVSASLLRASVGQRLVIALFVATVLWLAVAWALDWMTP